MNCGLIIPTLNAGVQFRTLLEQIAAQSLPTRKLIVDSESADDTARRHCGNYRRRRHRDCVETV